ncbi:hypothetical protein BaRGS_00025544 [Batillaria attramentaria]|uniref:Uncharacterized protein n=1 Tax=Batillaria attramentaria TaxID=370345 RepID=A0ABD0K842_9CAEN
MGLHGDKFGTQFPNGSETDSGGEISQERRIVAAKATGSFCPQNYANQGHDWHAKWRFSIMIEARVERARLGRSVWSIAGHQQIQ